MAVLLSCFVILLFPSISYQQWSIYLRPNPYAVGETNITLQCYIYISNFLNTTFEFRPNKNHDWLTVAYINESGKLIKQGYHEENFFSFLTFYDHSRYYYYNIFWTSIATIHNDRCTVDAELYPSFRCRAFKGSFVTSLEKSILSLKGNVPTSLSSIHNLWPRSNTKGYYEVGDVLQLQCTGEIESINSTPSKNIRWCKKEKELFRVISLQDHPTSSIVHRSKDGCTLTENSVIFYHITNRDTDLEIMCESGSHSYYCGFSGLNSSISIPTSEKIKEVQKWRTSPILIHNGKTWLNPQIVEVPGDEIGTTIHLLSTASAVSPNSSLTNVNWCTRKHGEKNWTNVILQDATFSRTQATSNSSGRVKIFSEITYHVTSLDTEIHFMFEISTHYKCGTGLESSNVSLHIVSGKQQQDTTKPLCNMAGLSVVIVLLILVVIFITICVIILCRRKEIRFLGWLIKLDIDQNQDKADTQAPRRPTNLSTTVHSRPSAGSSIRYVASPTTNGLDHNEDENRSHTNQGYEPETDEKPTDDYEEAVCSIAPKRESFYENEVLKQEKEMEVYEDLNTESSQQDYDDLKF
uniref:Uncharacterized protein LOC111115677 isoform X2 n=1 Tax=Crassostrea virginica TaxID=6565 RepID=A0A8B8C3E8_CRAVI|nr:uncharacterized protein LOC111115677 isoform X2 [Crassostrea virginica]